MRCSSWVGTKLLLQLLIKSPLPRGRTKEASPTHILSSLSPSPISRPTSGSRNQSPRTSWHTQRQYSASSSASCRRLDTAFVRHTCRTTSHQHHNTVLVLDRIRKEGGGKDSQLFLEGCIVLPLSFIYQVYRIWRRGFASKCLYCLLCWWCHPPHPSDLFNLLKRLCRREQDVEKTFYIRKS